MTGEGDVMASVRLVGLGSETHCDGEHDRRGRCSGLCSLSRRGFIQLLWRRDRELRELLWPVNAWSAWVQPELTEVRAAPSHVVTATTVAG